jgi:hypothetical protein
MLTSVSFAGAQAPTGGWSSGIACQNLDASNQAVVTLTFYAEGSAAQAIEYNSFINAGSSKNWLTTSNVSMPGFPSPFTGAAVISSSTELACNLNTQSTGTGTQSSPYRMGTAAGFNDQQTASVMFMPQVIKGVNTFNSYFAVQNTSNGSVTVGVTYYRTNGTVVAGANETAVIPAQSTKIFYQGLNTILPAGFNGSAKVTATTPADAKLAVVVALYKDGAHFSRSQFQSYNGFPGPGANKLFVPRFVRKLVGNNSGIAIQNVGTVASPIRADFNFQGTTYTVISPSAIQPGAAWMLYAPSISVLLPVDSLAESLRQGSAVITATNASARIVATVNEDNNVSTSGTRYGHGATYNAINAGDESNVVFFAQFTKNVGNIFSSGLQVSNTTNSAGTCNIQYAGQPGINENNVPLPAGGSITRWALSNATPAMKNMTNGYNAAVKVTCTQPVTGIVNMSAYGSKYGDSFTQTTGLNQ